MSSEDLRKVSTEVSNECWKKIKILSVQKEVSMSDYVRDLLERTVNARKLPNVEENIS